MSEAPPVATNEVGPDPFDQPDRADRPEAIAAGAEEPVGQDIDAMLAEVGRSGRRRWPALVLGATAGIVGTLAATASLDGQGVDDDTTAEIVELATAPVEQRDLVEEIEWSGTLGYGDPVAVRGPSGIVTSAADIGTTLERGDAVADVDGEPVVVLYGTTPLWRTLSEGSEGADVRQLEANLAMLGYDQEATVDIDEVFTAATEAMVERWQEDIGRESTGVVASDAVVVVEGPAAVVSIVEVGAPTTGQLATLAPRRVVDDVVAGIDGTISDLAPIGTAITSGQTLYRVDDVPVVAISPFDRVAAAFLDETFTNSELEQALRDGGHDPDATMTVDGVITGATTTAIERWQEASGVPVTGLADPGYYVTATIDHLVDAHPIDAGTGQVTGGPVLTTARSRLSVTLTVDVADADDFEVGQAVTVELADETAVDAVVTEIGSVTAAANPQETPTVEVVIGVTADQDDALVEGPVTVISIGEEIIDATLIPARSLVALAEGGFAVEKVDPQGQTELVAVELGTFTDGVVEVIGGDVRDGDQVVVPR